MKIRYAIIVAIGIAALLGITYAVTTAEVAIQSTYCRIFSCPTTGGNGGAPANALAGDYGDAPDNTPTGYPATLNDNPIDPTPTGFAQTGFFPTLYENNGARTLRTTDVKLGKIASVENDAIDQLDPDGIPNLTNGDLDDGLTFLSRIDSSIPNLPSDDYLTVEIQSDNGGTFYLNWLVDVDMDGRWAMRNPDSPSEWLVKNQQIVVTPQKKIERFSLALDDKIIILPGSWMRIAITTNPITTAQWDGSGVFASGEIEDYGFMMVGDGVCDPSVRQCIPKRECELLDPTCNFGGVSVNAPP